MNDKWSAVIVGFILMMLGVLYFVRDIMEVDYTAIIIICVGVYFLILYARKKRQWALIPCIYLIYFGFVRLLFENSYLFSTMNVSMFFIAPAIVFGVYYRRNKKRYSLTACCLLFSIGLASIVSACTGDINVNILLLFVGLAFVVDYLLAKKYVYKSRLYVGALMILLSIRECIKFSLLIDVIVSAGLVGVGAAIIVKALTNEKVDIKEPDIKEEDIK